MNKELLPTSPAPRRCPLGNGGERYRVCITGLSRAEFDFIQKRAKANSRSMAGEFRSLLSEAINQPAKG